MKKEIKKRTKQPEEKVIARSKWEDFFNRYQYAIIALLAFLMYANTLTFQYASDDRLLITQNEFTKKGVHGIKEILTNDAFTGFFGKSKSLVAGGRYRPLTQVMFAIEYQIFGLNPFIGHFINVLIFILTSLLLYHILRRLLAPYNRSQWLGSLAFLTTILFIVHPIHTEVVANIKSRDELMSLLGSLGALWFVIRYLETKKPILLIGIFSVFSIALFSKENAITFVAIIPFVLWFFYKSTWREYLSITAPLIIASIAFIAIRTHMLGGMFNTEIASEILNDPFINVPKSTAIATVIYTWGKYLVLLIFPHPLTHDYYPFQIPYFQFSDPIIILLTIFFITIVILTLWGTLKKKLWSFAVLFALISFSIQSNLVFNIGTFMNERFVFVPSIGVALLIGMLLTKLMEKKQIKSIVTVSIFIILGLYGGKTISRNYAWENDRTLFLTDVKTSTNSIKCNVSAGGMSLEMAVAEKDPSKKSELLTQSMKYLTKAQKLYPQNFYAWFLMGNGYVELKEWASALIYYRQAFLINRESPEVRGNVSLVAQQSWKANLFDVSADSYRLLSEIEPTNEEYQLMVADAYSRINKGKADSALVIINNVLTKNPNNASAWSKKGEIYGRVYNNLQEAELNLLKSIDLDPKNLSANENLGIVFGIKKNFERSIYYFNQALKIDSTQARIYLNIAGTYNAMGNKGEAERYKSKAKQYENK